MHQSIRECPCVLHSAEIQKAATRIQGTKRCQASHMHQCQKRAAIRIGQQMKTKVRNTMPRVKLPKFTPQPATRSNGSKTKMAAQDGTNQKSRSAPTENSSFCRCWQVSLGATLEVAKGLVCVCVNHLKRCKTSMSRSRLHMLHYCSFMVYLISLQFHFKCRGTGHSVTDPVQRS